MDSVRQPGRPAGAALTLAFHGIAPELLPPRLRAAPSVLRYTVSQETLAWALDRIDPRTCCTAANLENPVGGRPVVLTFDDGYRSDFEVVFPALASRGLAATFFVTVDTVGLEGYVNWEQLAAMSAAGMEIGSHGLTHRNLLSLRPAEARREIRRSKVALEERLGKPVTAYAPVGGHHRAWLVDEAWSAGYRVFGSLVPGRTALCPGVLFLRRNCILARHGPSRIGRLLRGDGLTLVASRVRYETLGSARKLLGLERYERLRALLLRRALP